MSAPTGWSPLHLAEYLAEVSSQTTELASVQAGVEGAAEAVEAEVAVLLERGTVRCAIGFGSAPVPHTELLSVCAGGDQLPVPGFGLCPAAVVSVDEGTATFLVVARVSEALSPEERAMLRAMARVLALVLEAQRTRSAERRLVEELRERERQLQRLVRITRSISHGAPLQEVLTAICQGAAELLDQEVVGVRLTDVEDPQWAEMVACVGVEAEILEGLRRSRVGEGAGGRAIAEDRLVVMEGYAKDPAGLDAFAARELQAAMAAPIHDQAEVIGSLTVASYRPRHYSPLDRDLLTAFADHASLAIVDARRVAATEHQAMHDELTGLANRALFLDRLERALTRRRGHGGDAAVLFCDVDQFKIVNDSMGHSTGDELLRSIATRISGCLRDLDTAARFGGDEFAVLIEDCSRDDAEAVGERLLAALRPPFVLAGNGVGVSASIGIALTSESDDIDDLLRFADVAMYRAKALGGARAAVFEPAMWSDMVARAELSRDLRRAVDDGAITLAYQPIVDLATLDVVGVEALARWVHPTHGPLPPSVFIQLAEEGGLIGPLGELVLTLACEQVRRWHEAAAELSLAVNVSAGQLADPALLDQVRRALATSRVDPKRLVLEITESVVMQDSDEPALRLQALKELGVGLAIDDFGTGYSSLGYLKRLPVDVLKVDRTLIEGIDHSPRDLALVRTVLSLAETLGLATVAEGVESVEQLLALRRIGCPLGQGYHICEPLQGDELAALTSSFAGSADAAGRARGTGSLATWRLSTSKLASS